jgi:hypothetical protein
MNLDAILSQPRRIRAITSMEAAEFEKLAEQLQEEWDRAHKRRNMDGQPRQRARGGGRRGALPDAAHKLLFILIYFKTYPTQDLMGAMFDLSQPQVCSWVHRLSPLLEKVLGCKMQLPERRAQKLHQVLERCPELTFVMDGTERPVNRPSSEPAQREHYSGRRRRHTVKNVVVVSGQKVQGLSGTFPGSFHDKTVAEAEWDGRRFPQGSVVVRDGGFIGLPAPGAQIWEPSKRPRGGEWEADERRRNRALSAVRVVVEHAISGMKRCRIVKDIFRNRKEGFVDTVINIACGLHNFRTDCRSNN